MANKMLIDAAHPEETRVVVLRGSRIEEFDFEAASKRQLRGNIYLAKVTRVEPSLQAAFVDYGGNRHGFLAFSEIHPDYYQIPMSDRQALMEEEQQEEPEDEEERRPRRSRRRRGGDRPAVAKRSDGDETVSEASVADDGVRPTRNDHPDEDHATEVLSPEPDRVDVSSEPEDETRPITLDAAQTPPYDDPTAGLIEHAEMAHAKVAAEHEAESSLELPSSEAANFEPLASDAEEPHAAATAKSPEGELASAAADADVGPLDHTDGESETSGEPLLSRDGPPSDEDDEETDEEDEHVEQLGGDAMEEVPRRAYRPRRQYKIQEVIKRRQVLLVQVVKEERGNKGAAITTYLSLAGRYSVLMPNTARGGGISRKITDASDRQRLKTIAQDLEVPDGMGVILRTAGASRSKPEVKRDFEYLMRMWETVRETTLQSSAPTLVYEEGSLIKRAIRDLYNKDVEEVVVSGEVGYREAKDFMRLLMPSHTKNVQLWRDPAPIFTKAGAEAQLDAMFSPQVTLKSGGYLVINQTEALVAIDVNSGRSTREHNIEDTAVRTNLEAADEVARQLRLRDLAGLIVVDFIDMEENRNNRAVEKRIKDALKDDRARIQVGRISHFGLLEMSRQRIRTGVLEGSTVICEHCAGAGSVRSTASIALHVLRLLEDALLTDASRDVTVRTRGQIALYVLNHKRAHLSDLEGRFGVAVTFEGDESLTGTTYCALERGEMASGIIKPAHPIALLEEPETEILDEPEDEVVTAVAGTPEQDNEEAGDGDARRKRRRRRGRGRDRESSGIAGDAPQPSDDALSFVADAEGGVVASLAPDPVADEQTDGGEDRQDATEDGGTRKRRSRRGGRRTRGRDRDGADGGEGTGDTVASQDEHAAVTADTSVPPFADHPVEQLPETGDHEPDDAQLVSASAVDTAGDDTVEPAIEHAPDPSPHEETIGAPAFAEPAHVEAMSTSAVETPVEPEPASEPIPRRPEPISTEADPARPKRAGWWSRAKASLGN